MPDTKPAAPKPKHPTEAAADLVRSIEARDAAIETALKGLMDALRACHDYVRIHDGALAARIAAGVDAADRALKQAPDTRPAR